MTREEIAIWIKDALKASGMTQTALAAQLSRAVRKNIDKAAVNKMLVTDPGKKSRNVSGNEMLAISVITGHPLPDHWTDIPSEDLPSPPSKAPLVLPPLRPADELRPEATRRGYANFKIFGTAEGGPGIVILTSDPIESREWPVELAGVEGAYGVLITNNSMIPALRPGEVALVNPHLPASPDSEVILQRDDHGTRLGMVKTLLRQTATEYRLKQWNPEKEFTRSKKEWPLCHLVVGKFRR